MLILTRRSGESIVIGDNVTVSVLSIQGNQIRLGIDAPRNVAVHREEIYLKIKESKAISSGLSHDEEPGNSYAMVAQGSSLSKA